jgi:hypothetical protein
MFLITIALFKDEAKPLHKRIAALLMKIFVEVEGNQFERRLDSVLDLICWEINFDNLTQVFFCITAFILKFFTIHLTKKEH